MTANVMSVVVRVNFVVVLELVFRLFVCFSSVNNDSEIVPPFLVPSSFHARSPSAYSELRNCAKEEEDVLGPVPNSPYGLCGRKATLEWKRLL